MYSNILAMIRWWFLPQTELFGVNESGRWLSASNSIVLNRQIRNSSPLETGITSEKRV